MATVAIDRSDRYNFYQTVGGEPLIRRKPNVATSSDWIIWQLADSAFPSGGFAHSGGIEVALRWGELRRADDLDEYLKTNLTQIAHSGVPFVLAANQDPQQFEELDQLCNAFLSNHVANRASRAQGQAFLIAAEAAFQRDSCKKLRTLLNEGHLIGHLPAVFGFVTAELDIDSESAARLFLYIGLRGLVSSAVRLNLIGPLKGQAIQSTLGPFADQLCDQCICRRVDEVAQTAPIIDILQQTQDRLYSRLFQS